MTAGTLSRAIGKAGTFSTEQQRLSIRVRVYDARTSYGQIQYFIEPLLGSGRIWVDSTRVRLDQDEAARG